MLFFRKNPKTPKKDENAYIKSILRKKGIPFLEGAKKNTFYLHTKNFLHGV
jgi:hypothetical protein